MRKTVRKMVKAIADARRMPYAALEDCRTASGYIVIRVESRISFSLRLSGLNERGIDIACERISTAMRGFFENHEAPFTHIKRSRDAVLETGEEGMGEVEDTTPSGTIEIHHIGGNIGRLLNHAPHDPEVQQHCSKDEDHLKNMRDAEDIMGDRIGEDREEDPWIDTMDDTGRCGHHHCNEHWNRRVTCN
jgi:hypothetical protein